MVFMETTKEEQTSKKNKTLKKIGNIIFYTLFSIFLVIAVFSIVSRATNGRIGNSQFLVVLSGSMDGEKQEEYEIKTIPTKSLIKIDLIEDGKEEEFYSSLKKGDVLTFNYVPLGNETITHRIIEDPVKFENGVYEYTLKGDAVEGESNIQTLYSDGRTGEIIGKVSYVSLPLGELYFFISSKVGTLVLVVLPCSAIFIFEIVKIIYLVSENKRKLKEAKVVEEKNQKDKEIEDLKAQLEILQKKEKSEEEK